MTQEKDQPKNPKNMLVLTIGLLSYFSLVPSAFAQLVTCPLPPFEAVCFQKESIGGILGALVSLIFIFAVIAALLYLLWGAVRWIFSGGDKTGIEGARGQIIASIIGLIILFLSFLVINILLGFFNINIGEINFPSIPPS